MSRGAIRDHRRVTANPEVTLWLTGQKFRRGFFARNPHLSRKVGLVPVDRLFVMSFESWVAPSGRGLRRGRGGCDWMTRTRLGWSCGFPPMPQKARHGWAPGWLWRGRGVAFPGLRIETWGTRHPADDEFQKNNRGSFDSLRSLKRTAFGWVRVDACWWMGVEVDGTRLAFSCSLSHPVVSWRKRQGWGNREGAGGAG